MRINYDFNDLEAFLAVKETGSFHLAATKLNLSQSAVTRRVQKLEAALDSVLFERTTRAVKPTLAAKRLQARAEAILDDADEATRAMRDESVALSYQRGAVLTVAVIPTIVSRVLSPALDVFRRLNQKTRLRFLDGSANDVAEAVAAGEADFGLSAIPMLEPTTEFEPLMDDQIVLAVPKGHDLDNRSDVSWSEISDMTLILPARGTGNRLLIDEALARARLPLHWTYEVGRSTTAIDLVQGGAGMALVPRSTIDTDRVGVCTLATPSISRSIGLLSRIGQADTQAANALKQAIRSVC